MPSIEDKLASVDNYQEQMVQALSDMIRIPAIGPESGGDGEFLRSRMLKDMIEGLGFDEVEILEALDDRVKLRSRPNLIARKKGRSEQTVWFVSHMDTVPPGDLQAWSSPPFSPRIDDGKLYGLGSEDNGQALIATMFACKLLLDMGGPYDRSFGIVLVADEEMGSDKGIKFMIGQDVFKKGDIIYVPDFGMSDGSAIEVAEKTIMWLEIRVSGKQTHASTPNKGLNAGKVGAELIAFLGDYMDRKYGKTNPLFDPPVSTYEPTKHLLNVNNINTIPGEDVFYLDFRILPDYDPDEIMKSMRWIADLFEDKTGAVISMETVQMTRSGTPSSTDSVGYKALSNAIKKVRGVEPKAMGIGGGTCANIFRLAGHEAYVWETVDELAHTPNEYCKIENLVSDMRVFSTILASLCLNGKK